MKNLVIIQARMGSTRLPQKIMMPLNGIPLIQHLINAFSCDDNISDVVVATSIKSENDEFVDYLNKHKIKYFRGSENDVLSRFINIINIYNPETVIRITADDPLMSTEILDISLKSHYVEEADYSFMKGLPIGISPEIVKASVLKEIYYKNNLTDYDREHVTTYLKSNKDLYRINFIDCPEEYNYPELSLTIDTLDQYNDIKGLYDIFGNHITLKKVISYLTENKHEKI